MNDTMTLDRHRREGLPFPLDWTEWRKLWEAWRDEQTSGVRGVNGRPPNLKPTAKRFRGINLLADEKLGTWEVNGRIVELSEVRFPALGERPRREDRYVGVCFGVGRQGGDGLICSTFAELEEALGIGGDR